MKSTIITLSYVLLLVGLILGKPVIAQTDKGFILEGKILGLKNPTKLYLCIYPGIDTVSKTITNNGRFIFKGKVSDRANIYYIKMDTLVSKKPSKAIWLINERIKMNSSLAIWPNLEINGSVAHDDYKTLLQSLKLAKDKGIDENKIRIDFIKNHTNSLSVSKAISNYKSLLGLDGTIEAYANLTSIAKSSYFGLELKKEIEQLKLAEQMKSGAVLPDFKLSSSEGKIISILDYVKRGKVTLIDFWASWCIPCRAEAPNMKKVYNAFHDQGFNIIGVSTDKNELAWKRALEEDSTPWFHGRDNLEIAHKAIFSIAAIPAFALVDGEGKLIAFSCASSSIPSFGPEIRGEGLHKTIQDLLIKKDE